MPKLPNRTLWLLHWYRCIAIWRIMVDWAVRKPQYIFCLYLNQCTKAIDPHWSLPPAPGVPKPYLLTEAYLGLSVPRATIP